MLQLLNKPYPKTEDFKQIILTGLLVSVFVSSFLLVFQPFGMAGIQSTSKYIQIASYGLVTLGGIAVVDWIPRLIWRKYFSESRWTVGKQIFWMMAVIVVIALGNMSYTSYLGYSRINVTNAIYFTGFTVAVGFFPIMAMVLMNYSRLLRTHTETAQLLNSELTEKAETEEPRQETLLSWAFIGENANEELHTDSGHLLFIESADNYSTFYIAENGAIRKKMLRGSLKSMLDQALCDELFRCHRTYIVNMTKVVGVSGNSQGYRLKIEGTDQEVPVARASGKEFHERLRKLKA